MSEVTADQALAAEEAAAMDKGQLPTPAEPPKEAAKKTSYVVLVAQTKQPDPTAEASKAVIPLFLPTVTLEAANDKAAVRDYIATLDKPDGTYVAVPARSWRPVTVKTETTTKTILA